MADDKGQWKVVTRTRTSRRKPAKPPAAYTQPPCPPQPPNDKHKPNELNSASKANTTAATTTQAATATDAPSPQPVQPATAAATAATTAASKGQMIWQPNQSNQSMWLMWQFGAQSQQLSTPQCSMYKRRADGPSGPGMSQGPEYPSSPNPIQPSPNSNPHASNVLGMPYMWASVSPRYPNTEELPKMQQTQTQN